MFVVVVHINLAIINQVAKINKSLATTAIMETLTLLVDGVSPLFGVLVGVLSSIWLCVPSPWCIDMCTIHYLVETCRLSLWCAGRHTVHYLVEVCHLSGVLLGLPSTIWWRCVTSLVCWQVYCIHYLVEVCHLSGVLLGLPSTIWWRCVTSLVCWQVYCIHYLVCC